MATVQSRMSTQTNAAPAGKRRGPALSAQGLTKRFGDRVAFQDVSFEIGCGEVFGFLGPNGAGKTTTVRTLGPHRADGRLGDGRRLAAHAGERRADPPA
jgi:ATPase subunit of ABC transporter with duplicated ATPase domains